MMQSNVLNMNPLVKIVVTLIGGMTVGRYTMGIMSDVSWLVVAIFGLGIVGLSKRNRWLQSGGVLISVAAVGGLLMMQAEKKMLQTIPEGEKLYDAVLLSEPVKHGKVIMTDLAVQTNNGNIKVKASILCDTLTERYKRLHVGDGITAYSALEKPINFADSQFDYVRWLRAHGYYANTFIYYRNWQKAAIDLSFLSYVDRTMIELKRIKRQCVETYTHVGLSGEAAAVAIAMTLGDKSLINKDLKDDYSISGASHVLALSGLHLGIIYVFLIFAFNLCKGIPYLYVLHRYRVGELFAMLFIWIYALLVDFSPSVVRSATMLTIYSFVRLLNRDKFSLNTLALTAIIMLVVNPLNLWDIGFQLSFIAVLFILLFSPLIYGIVPRKRLQRFWILRWVWGLLTVSVAAQIGTAPLVAYYFGRFSCYFLLSNFVVIPCATLILYAAVLLFLFSFIPVMQVFIGNFMLLTIQFMNNSLHTIAHWQGASIENLQPNELQVALLYFVIFCIGWIWSFFANRSYLK